MPIRKKRQYNSDYMSREMDARLELLEDNLTALYASASSDVMEKYTDWISQYQDKDNAMRAKLEAGDIDEGEYLNWRRRAIVKGEQYKQTVKSLTDILVNADLAAMATIRGELPIVIAESYNFVSSLGFNAADEAGLSVGTFQVYNAQSVQKLIKDNPKLLPEVDIPEDEKWNQTKITQEITKGIVTGDSIPQVANRLQAVTNMDRNSAIRNARTSMTGAENLGRNESFHDIKKKGVPCKLQWSATHDGRTRDTHIMLDGSYQDDDGYFGADFLAHPLRYPADKEGDAEEIYNCRCRASLRLDGIDHSQDGKLYEEFMKENYPEDWDKVKEQREAKEAAYQENKKKSEKKIQKNSAQSSEKAKEEKPKTEINIPEKVQAKLDKFESKYYEAKNEHSMLVSESGEVLYEDTGKKTSAHFAPSYGFAENLPQGTYSIHNHPAQELYSVEDLSNYAMYGTHGLITTPDGYEHLLFNTNKPVWNIPEEERIGTKGLAGAWNDAISKINDEWLQERRNYVDAISGYERAEQRQLMAQWDSLNNRTERQVKWLEENAEEFGYYYRRRKIT